MTDARCMPILSAPSATACSMDLSAYQSASRQFAAYPAIGFNAIYPTLGLCGESGEVAEKVKKVIRDNDGKFSEDVTDAIALELGDVLWYVAQVASELGLDLNHIAQRNIDKLTFRQQRGTLQGSGDNR